MMERSSFRLIRSFKGAYGQLGLRSATKCFSRPFSSTTNVYDTPDKQEYTQTLDLQGIDSTKKRPSFRVMDERGQILNGVTLPSDIDKDLTTKLYECMVRLQVMDQVLYEVQRQGRIPFYMTSTGEEGATVGSSSSLFPQDIIFSQYREAGVFMYRGLSIEEMMDQCFATIDDSGKGRQMPVHYGSQKYNIHTVSSPLATQIPQAAGAAYALKTNENNDAVSVCYFGEGAASEGDFHGAMNIAATLECPVLFFCRNNGYAISTPTKDQFRGDGISSRAAGYGMESIKVDGNDVFAVRLATQMARNYCVENNKPILVEAMSYRMGHHSTSDDSTTYRDVEEIEIWKKDFHPIPRLRSFMEDEQRKWWDEDKEKSLRNGARKEVLENVKKAETKDKPDPIENMFTDVYDHMPQNLLKQKQELIQHVSKYPDHYDIGQH